MARQRGGLRVHAGWRNGLLAVRAQDQQLTWLLLFAIWPFAFARH